jgi:hypothetical protein
VKRLALSALFLLMGAAARPAPMSISPVSFPFGHPTATPYVVVGDNGAFDVSWVDRAAHTFNFASFDGANWSRPRVIARGDMLDNKADYPSIAVSGRNMFAQWREAAGKGRVIRLARSSDGGMTWTAALTPHPAMRREFGFVSMLPLPDGGARIAWLDGRTPATALRAATITIAGKLTSEAIVDPRVCDCCQTSMAMTTRGPVVVYRDRSAKEIRDIAIAAPVANAPEKSVHDDGWYLTGCPVNGPRIQTRGAHAVVAWFTGAGDKPAVNVAFSADGGAKFAAPIRVDAGHPAGRVDVALLDDGSAIVTWIESAKGARLFARRVTTAGTLDPPLNIGSGPSPASMGFPRIAFSHERIFAAWNGDDGVQLALLRTAAK